jgi:hypothetical protein
MKENNTGVSRQPFKHTNFSGKISTYANGIPPCFKKKWRDDMENFLKETIAKLKANGKEPCDVQWVQTSKGKYCCEWEEFKKMANEDYNSGFGGQEVRSSLVVVGGDWWMERHGYDGSEWWEFKQPPQIAANSQKLDWVFYEDGIEGRQSWNDYDE